MIKEPQKKRRFSRLEILIYVLIVLVLFLAIFLFTRGLLAEARDKERIENIGILEEGLENYFKANEKYPQVLEWECLERDVRLNGTFWQEMKNYLPEIPRDPFYDPFSPIFCFHYKSADEGKEYKLYVTLEKKKKVYQVFSKGGEWIFTGKLGEMPWHSPDWKFRKKIKIFSQKVANDLENFPVLVYLKDENLRERAKSDASDILFVSSDGKTLLKREIEKYDSETGELVVWVKVPSLSSIEDTEIYMYYGSPETTQVNEKDTWDEDFLAVYHFNEISGTTTDATVNGNDGTPEGKLIQGAEGKIFLGVKFDGKDDFINLGASETFYEMENFTLQAWVFPEGEVGEDKIFGLEGAQYRERGIFGWEGSDSGPWQLVTSLSETSFGRGYLQLTFDNPLELNQWNFIAGVFGEGQMTLFVNGEKTSREIRHKIELIKREEKFAAIGRYFKESLISDSKVWRSYSFSGILDEIRISKVARPLAWLETSFQNQKDPASFIELGEEELY